MASLNFPAYSFKIKTEGNRKFIFDRLRKKYVSLQPEEWVRQHMIEFLIAEKHYPPTLIGNEISLTCNSLQRRCDTVVYNNFGTPVMIIEYKAPMVEITQQVFDQISMYNRQLKVEYLLVSNGLKHYCCKVDFGENKYIFLENIPNYLELF